MGLGEIRTQYYSDIETWHGTWATRVAARWPSRLAIFPEEARSAIEIVNGMTLSNLRRKAVKLPLDRDELDEMLAEWRAREAWPNWAQPPMASTPILCALL